MDEDLPLRIVYLGQIFIFRTKSFFRHPVLGVLLCGNCLEFYARDDWTRDEKGNYEQCRFIRWAMHSESAWNYLKKWIDLKQSTGHWKPRIGNSPNSQVVRSGWNLVPMWRLSSGLFILFFSFVGWFILLFRHSARSAWAKMWAGKILFNFESPKSATKSKDSFQGIY